MKTKKQTTREAQATLRRMKGRGWKCVVTRLDYSSPWYWYLTNGSLTLWKSPVGRFHCLLSADREWVGPGEMFWHTTETFRDPNRAVSHQLAEARKFVDNVAAIVGELEDRILERAKPKKGRRDVYAGRRPVGVDPGRRKP